MTVEGRTEIEEGKKAKGSVASGMESVGSPSPSRPPVPVGAAAAAAAFGAWHPNSGPQGKGEKVRWFGKQIKSINLFRMNKFTQIYDPANIVALK